MFCCSLQIMSHLDSQSKFQMFTLLFSGRHIGAPWRYTNEVGTDFSAHFSFPIPLISQVVKDF